MKTIILIVAMLLSSVSYAQHIDDWHKITNDSFFFHEKYGSIEEYNYQHTNWQPGKYAFQIHFIGTKFFYLQEVFKWLVGKNLCGSEVQEDDDNPGYVEFTNEGCNVQNLFKKPKPLKVRAYIDNNLRIESVEFKGEAELMIRFFIFYWQGQMPIQRAEYKKGFKVYKDFLGDRVYFDWSNNDPVVRIVKTGNGDVFHKLVRTDR